MMHREIKKLLRSAGNEKRQALPNETWVKDTRAILLQQINNTVRPVQVSQEKTARFAVFIQRARQVCLLFIPKNVLAFGRSVSMVALAMSVAIGGWIASVSASVNSLPGDTLYHVKLATEKTELIVAAALGSEKNKVETLLKHASNRVEEYQKSKTPDQAVQVIESLKKSITSTNESLQKAESSAAVEVAKVVNEKTEKLLESLSDAPASGLETAIDSETAKKVGEAAHLLETTGVNAVEVLVEQTLAGNTDTSMSEVKATVEKKLEKIATDVTHLNQDVAAVSATVTANPQPESPVVVEPSPGDLATTTVAVTDGGNISLSTEEAMKATEQKVGEVSKIVEQGIAEAKTLIENNDLLGAVKKVQTLTEVKKDADSVVREVKMIGTALAPTQTGTPAPASTATGTQQVTEVKQ